MSNKVAVLLDTSFFIRFLNENDPLCESASQYYEYFIRNNIDMLISTISIAEYCTLGEVEGLPLRNLQITPFNFEHAIRTAEFANIAFEARRNKELKVEQRLIIPNDTKLFAQASIIPKVQYYLSSDSNSKKVYNAIKSKYPAIGFNFIDLSTNYNDAFGVLL